jgi:pimeloyl-ACP methyl ester carboxylesterase
MTSTTPPAAGEVVEYPDARRPDRSYSVEPRGVRLAVYEWGEETARPLFLVHGGFDFAGTFDVFAPKLADGGFRVVSWDQRGHGDSQHTALYSWEADLRDATTVMESVTSAPAPVIGHSKGGAMMLQLADAQPHRFAALINLDGLPSRRPAPDIADHDRSRMLATEVDAWLDHRRRTAELIRKPGTLDDLARRRGRMNPRLSPDWLRYLVPIGARHDPDGWRWKIDATMRFGGFGPWRPEWSILRLPGLGMPFLGVLATEKEEMGWGTRPDEIAHLVPPQGELVALEDTGHFLHIERPELIASMVLEFLDRAGV